MLTPEEFVKAGDQLIRACPSWQWESGEKSKIRPYLPPDKQFLSTKGVPSYRRLSTLLASKVVEDTREGDWCAPDLQPPSEADDDAVLVEMEDEFANAKMSDAPGEMSAPASSSAAPVKTSSAPVDEYEDMEDASLALDEAATSSVQKSSDNKANTANDNNIIRSRRYDVSITYDNYYRTPRIWLFGFDENGSTLSTHDIFQDIMQDYANKTVTIDPHPHLSRPHASVHPCQHGAAMLKIIEALKECGDAPRVEQYLFIFLKFIQSVIPTIEYDYTIDVAVRGNENS